MEVVVLVLLVFSQYLEGDKLQLAILELSYFPLLVCIVVVAVVARLKDAANDCVESNKSNERGTVNPEQSRVVSSTGTR